jgi:hypothetical protein
MKIFQTIYLQYVYHTIFFCSEIYTHIHTYASWCAGSFAAAPKIPLCARNFLKIASALALSL